MKSYEQMARETYKPLVNRYDLKFVVINTDEFFLIGSGFALWIFVDLRDRRADTWYVSVDDYGNVLTYTLMYINKERFTSEDRANYGKPIEFNDYIEGDMRVICSGLLNHCRDILAGDKMWLQGYQGKGHYNSSVTKLLAPYFSAQGYPVIIEE